MESTHDNPIRSQRPVLWLLLFLLLLAAASGGLLVLRPAAHPTRHYLLTGRSVFAFEGGRTLWHHPLPAFKMSLPATMLVEDHLYVAAGSVYALDKETGRQLWQRQIPLVTALFTQEQIATSLFWQEGRLSVETDTQVLVQLDPQTGTIVWEYVEAEEAEISPPAFSSRGDVIYVVTRQQRGQTAYEVTAMSAGERRLLWQQCFLLPALPDQWGPVLAPLVQEPELLLVPLGDTVVPLRTTDGHLLPPGPGDKRGGEMTVQQCLLTTAHDTTT
jgi:outer membrane protein assembly factor BamB